MISQRIRELAAQPFHRPGGIDFDIKYALAIWDARDRVRLDDEINTHPGESVSIMIGADGLAGPGSMGFVPHEDGSGTLWRIPYEADRARTV